MPLDLVNLFETLDPALAYQGIYNLPLVALSVATAVMASFVALLIADRMGVVTARRSRLAWAGAGALAMGGGIWSMHFIGMLAFVLPCGVRYDPVLTLASIAPGVLASGVALSIISRPSPGFARLALGAVLMGGGIGAMHYAGMAAMQPAALMRFDARLVGVSVLVAVVLAFSALAIRSRLGVLTLSKRLKTFIAALVMGCAIPSMHYTAMLAAVFYPVAGVSHPTSIPATTLALTVAGFGLLLTLIALAAAAAGEQREIANRLLNEVAQRKVLEEAAQTSAARLQAIFDAVVDGIVSIDGEGRIQQWSSGAERIFGYAPHEAIGRNAAMLHHDNALPDFRGAAAIVTGAPREMTGLRKDGTEFPMELSVSAAARPNGETLLTGIVRDITARKRAEQDLILARVQAEAAEAGDRAKSDFLAAMSHELRTPLNAVIGLSAVMEGQSLGPLSERYLGLVDVIGENGRRLLTLIEDVLDLANADKLTLATGPVKLRDVVAELEAEMRGAAEKKQVLLTCSAPPVLPDLIADRARVKRILDSLVSNAIKFTQRGGKVTLSAVLAADGDLVVEVRDNGVGMSAEAIARALSPFGQTDTGATRRQGGAGVGLPLARRLVELHGAQLSLASVVGEGVAATVLFPRTLLLAAAA